MNIPEGITPQEVDKVIEYLQRLLGDEKRRCNELVNNMDNLLDLLNKKDFEIIELKKQIIDRGIC
jgi:hypothetical protein